MDTKDHKCYDTGLNNIFCEFNFRRQWYRQSTMTSLPEEEVLLFDNYSYYDEDYPVYEEGDIPAIPLDGNHWTITGLYCQALVQVHVLAPVPTEPQVE